MANSDVKKRKRAQNIAWLSDIFVSGIFARRVFFAGAAYYFGMRAAFALHVILTLYAGASLLIFSAVTAFLSVRRQYGHLRSILSVVAVVCAFTGFAFVNAGTLKLSVIEPLYDLAGRTVEIEAVVTARDSVGPETAQYILGLKHNGKTVRISTISLDRNVEIGDKVRFKAKFSRFKNNALFESESYNFSRGVLIEARAAGAFEVIHTEKNPLQKYFTVVSEFRSRVIQTLNFHDKTGLISGICIGDKSGIPQELRIAIARSGIAHFTSVSGMHLSLIVCLLMLVLQKIGGIFQNYVVRLCILFVILFILCTMFNFTMSVMRSAIMLAVYYFATAFFRKTCPLNSVGFAVLLITAVSPFAAFDIGLAMSAVGVVSIAYFSPAVYRMFFVLKRNSFAEFITACLVTPICLIPFSAAFFDMFSIVAPITTVLITIPASLCLYVMLIYVPLSLVHLSVVSEFCAILRDVCVVLADFIAYIAKSLSSLKYAAVYTANGILPKVLIPSLAILFAICVHCALTNERLRRFLHRLNHKKNMSKRVAKGGRLYVIVNRFFRAKFLCVRIAMCVIPLIYILSVYGNSRSNDDTTYFTMFSSGSQAAIIMSKGDESIIVTTGDNKGLYKKLSDESNLRYAIPRKVVLLGGNPIQTYSTRYLLSGGEPNNKSPLPSNFVVGGSDDYISIGDICEIVLQYNDSKDGVPATDAFIKTDSVSIAFVSAKTFVEGNIDASDYSAVVIYGYRKKLISADFPRNVYFADKRIHSESANNIYYETTRFEITENSFVQLGVNNERK